MNTRFIPQGSIAVRAKNSSAVAYLRTSAGRPIAMGYYGKQQKADFHHGFQTEEQRAKWLAQWFANIARIEAGRAVRKAQRAEEMRSACELRAGDVLTGSWGYDQTNVEWFEVVAVRGRTVDIRELCVEILETGYMQGKSIPLPGRYLNDKTETRRCMPGGRVKLHTSCNLYKAERNIVAGMPAGFKAAQWTAYA